MVAGSERHFRIDHYVVAALGDVGVERAVDHALVGYHDRLEIVLFPFVVPVLSLDFRCRPRGLYVKRKCPGQRFHVGGVVGLSYIGRQTGAVGDKTFKSGVGQNGGHDVGHIFSARVKVNSDLHVIVHVWIELRM